LRAGNDVPGSRHGKHHSVPASEAAGRALAVALSRDGYRVGVVARRTELLTPLQAKLTGPCVIKTIDVSQPELAMPLVRELLDELRDVELFIVSAGTGFENAMLAWEPERDAIAVRRARSTSGRPRTLALSTFRHSSTVSHPRAAANLELKFDV
jgi:NAD(P)-dependent dehydrogenase (short-subunit alcohol dehydrogenase family)